MNKIFIIGNLTKDPELRTTQTGLSVCSFNVAVNKRFSEEKEAQYFKVSAWRALGENCAKYLSKGKKVAVVGELQLRTYKGNDDRTYHSLDITADEIEFLTPRASNPQMESAFNAAGFETAGDEELPF